MSEPEHNLYGILTICKTNQSTTKKATFYFDRLCRQILYGLVSFESAPAHTRIHPGKKQIYMLLMFKVSSMKWLRLNSYNNPFDI